MNSFHYDYAVIGGDLRQVYLAAELVRTGCHVCQYALCRSLEQVCPDQNVKDVLAAPSFEDACRSASCIICPIPLSRDGIFLNQNRSKKNIPLQQLLMHLTPDQIFCAGCIPKELRIAAREKNLFLFDFMKDITLSQFNSIATAEGVIGEAIRICPKNLHQSKCAVFGYGVCGRTITDYLKRMYSFVTVATDPVSERAQAALTADEALDLKTSLKYIGNFDFIFNTIPSVIFTKDILSRLKPDTVILDIASHPGGIDFNAAKEFPITAMACPGLPGKYAPLSSAKAIRASVGRAKTEFERS